MTDVFDDVRLPEMIEQGSTGGPSFNTSIVRLGNGKEARNQNWQQQRMVYDVAYGITSSEQTDAQDFYTLMSFFYARRGRYRGFRFKDWTDYQATQEPCAGSGVVWQLQKTYAGPIPYTRTLTRPVVGTVTMLNGDNTIIDPSGYTVDYTTGLVTFAAGKTTVKATFDFDVPVRFDTDIFTLTIQLFNAGEVQSLTITEL